MLTLGNITLGALMGILSPVMYLVGFLAGQMVIIAGNLVNWTLNLNAQVLSSKAVEVGWVVSRDITNLGFVLAIIMISFVTILRIETYQVKKLLTRLVMAALLVNFSLVFSGLFIDFSGTLTNFFLQQATSGDLPKLGEGLVNATKVHSILDQKKDEESIKKDIAGLADDWNKMVVFFTSLFFVAIFTIIVAISLISLALMFYIRYIALNLLLILMPIALLLWIWPDVEGYWKKWWGEFLHWVFFAPAVSFFIYLALLIGTAFKKNPIPVDISSSATMINDLGAGLGQMIAVLGILWGGMYVANKMGVMGADIAYTLSGKVKGNLLGAVGGAGAYAAGGAFSGVNRLATTFGGKTINERLKGVTARLSGVPLVGGAMQNWNKQLTGAGKAREEELIKHYDSLDKDSRANSGTAILDPVDRAAWMASMAKNKQLGKAKEILGGNFERFAQSAIDRGGQISKELISKDPNLAKYAVKRSNFANAVDFDRAQRKEVGKAVANMAVDAINDLSLELLTDNADYISQARNSLILKFGEQRSHEDKAALYESMAKRLSILRANNLRTSEDDALERNLSAKLQSMAKSPAWAGYITDTTLIKKQKEAEE